MSMVQAMTVTDLDEQIRQAKITLREREDKMTAQYGEVVNFTGAARILGVNRSTVQQMLEDGRLSYACAGTRVDVRSIAAYIMMPKAMDHIAKNKKLGRVWAI